MNNLEKIFNQSYILASKSPRRIQLLKQIGLKFISIDSGIEELIIKEYSPITLIKINSESKSRTVAYNYYGSIIIGADTVVTINKSILNKPVSKEQAIEYLKLLSGKRHIVYTGINVINTKSLKEIFDYEKTLVYFRILNIEEIEYYVEKYSPLDKAGAYGIQDDFGCLFIEKIVGDYYNIVGLPLVKLYKSLLKII